MSSAAMEKLQTFDWYVGFVPKKHLQKFFRSAGDWCVRGSCAKGDVELMICALGEDHELHDFLIRERPSKSGRVGWSLRKEATSPPFFRELPDLVCLKDPIQRPKIFLKAGVLQCAAVTLGQGQYGKVVRGVYEKYGKQCDVAVKIPKHPDVRGFCSPHSDKLLRELQQQLVLTLAPGGSLLEHLRRYRDGIRYEEKVIFLLEAARGYKFVHEAKEAWEDEKELQIPIAWLAPECLRRTARYSRKSDVFAFAVLMYEVLHDGAQPWPEIGDLDEIIRLVRAGRRMTLTARVPPPMRDLLAVCWAQHAYLRPEFHEITRRLRDIADRLKLPRAEKRSVAKEPGVAIRPFFLDDPADFEVGELSPPPSSKELAKLDKRLSAEASKEDARRKTHGTPESVEATPTKAPTMVAAASSSTTNPK
ncbi:Tyrosine-protein kinase [Aphelenchoides fujianensis]|nr:Tyrosine-protein kinase [Aphelenchoides fujianensis]